MSDGGLIASERPLKVQSKTAGANIAKRAPTLPLHKVGSSNSSQNSNNGRKNARRP